MRVDIWSDVVCPWCYVGKRRLERALAAFTARHPEAAAGGAEPVEVVWRSFQLDPSAPSTPQESVAEHLGRKYGGGPEAGRRMVDQMEAVAAEEGLVYRLSEAQRVGTRDAHRLLHGALAVSPALQDAVKERLLAAYFLQARDVADHDGLVALAVEAGMAEDAARAALADDAHADGVEADLEQALAHGIGGVPFAVVDGRYAVNGAQPAEVFEAALDRAWEASHPGLVPTPSSAAAAPACGPDGCEPGRG